MAVDQCKMAPPAICKNPNWEYSLTTGPRVQPCQPSTQSWQCTRRSCKKLLSRRTGAGSRRSNSTTQGTWKQKILEWSRFGIPRFHENLQSSVVGFDRAQIFELWVRFLSFWAQAFVEKVTNAHRAGEFLTFSPWLAASVTIEPCRAFWLKLN